MRRIASLHELRSTPFRSFMSWVNAFARAHGLRVHTDWSKIWEYPWTWQYLCAEPFPRMTMLDIGSELSPMPWFYAALGAQVYMVEREPSFVGKWQELNDSLGFNLSWSIVAGSRLPLAADSCDLVTSYSVIEHIPDKETAVDEAVRVLKPGGILCLTFDICDPARGMTFPDWNGTALDFETFDRLIWKHGDLEPLESDAAWNLEDIAPFLEWHRTSAAHHNYVVGGALLRKRAKRRARKPVLVHLLDTGVGSGNTGDDAMFVAAVDRLPSGFDLTAPVRDLDLARNLPPGVRYVAASDEESMSASLRAADLVLLLGGTPVMDAWGIDWPLRANARALEQCRELGKRVHAVGVGIDRLSDPEALQIFREHYLGIETWTVRSVQCKSALKHMGVDDTRILVGADLAWLLPFDLDVDWAATHLREHGMVPDRPALGINLVNEVWAHHHQDKARWAVLLDRLVERHGAQVFFFCSEARTGEYFDRAAAEEVRGKMRCRSAIVAARQYTPSEMVSLLACMRLTISQRYHFTVFSVLADICPISLERGQKMRSLNADLDLPFVCNMEHVDERAIEREFETVLSDSSARLASLRSCRSQLRVRARNNFALLNYFLSAGAR
jgi:polysaccharide pyruvyl transferase WcaK-like protein/SAM-dependent methyltransferase